MSQFKVGERVLITAQYGLGLPRFSVGTFEGYSKNGGYITITDPSRPGMPVQYSACSVSKLSQPVLISKDACDVCFIGASVPWEPHFETLDYHGEDFTSDPGLAERLYWQIERQIANQERTVDYYAEQIAKAQRELVLAEQWLAAMQSDMTILQGMTGLAAECFEPVFENAPRAE